MSVDPNLSATEALRAPRPPRARGGRGRHGRRHRGADAARGRRATLFSDPHFWIPNFK